MSDFGGVEVEESADVGLVGGDARVEKCGFAGQVFEGDAEGVPVDLFVGDAVDEYLWVFVGGQPGLCELGAQFEWLGAEGSHE